MSEDDFDLEVEDSEEKAEPETREEESPDLAKLRRENRNLRTRLRRAELTTKYGAELVELIPEELPLTKWESYAAKLAERLRPESPPPKDETTGTGPEGPESVVDDSPTPEERKLAGVGRETTTGATTAGPMSWAEFSELHQKNPAQAVAEAGRRGMAEPGDIGVLGP